MRNAMLIAAGLVGIMAGAATQDLAAQAAGRGRAQAGAGFVQREQRASTQQGEQRAATQQRGVAARGVERGYVDAYDRRGEISGGRGDYYDRAEYDRYFRNRHDAPPFCRSGSGHPSFGRQWCYEKGYGLGNDYWWRAGWDNVIFGRTSRLYAYRGDVTGAILQEVLGRVVYGRLIAQAGVLGGGTLRGHWLDAASGPRILQVHAGTRPLAELYDLNRDNRVDLIMLNRGR